MKSINEITLGDKLVNPQGVVKWQVECIGDDGDIYIVGITPGWGAGWISHDELAKSGWKHL